MDVQMPNLDGLQSTRLIRQSGFSSPIVALTAYAEESNVKVSPFIPLEPPSPTNKTKECLDSGMDFFLSKPIRRPALKHVLKTYCPTIPEEDTESNTPPGTGPSKHKDLAGPSPAPFTLVATHNHTRDVSPAISPSSSPAPLP
jgi:osomolarity two-component system sensor histidine kinase SLN1